MEYTANKYIDDVINNRIKVCKWVRLAVKRHLDDLENGHKRGLWFDEEAAKHRIDFFSFCKHSKGEWAGQIFRPEPWQQFISWVLYGWKNEKGYRRFRTAYIEVARKNGKTTTIATDGLYGLIADNEPGAEIYSVATKREQAQISHTEAKRMVMSSPSLRKKINIYNYNLNITETASKYMPLASDSKTLDGLNVHMALVDELHAHKTRELWDVLDTATAARRQPLMIAITTAGYNKQSICWEQHEYTEKILENILQDDTFWGIIYTLDEEDDWQDESNWIKANPNLNVSVKLTDLRRKAQKAKETPASLNAFLRLHLDKWTEVETRWMSSEKWDACAFPVDADGLRGRTCYAGLDLSSNIDITAYVLVFPPEHEDDKYKIIPKFWIPQDNIRERVKRDRVNYDVWVRQGLITATPGNVIDYSWILNEISESMQKYDVQEIAFDKWGATKIIQDIQEMVVDENFLVAFWQGYNSMSQPSKELETLVLKKKIAHGGNPVLSWMMSNVMMIQDPSGKIKPDKAKSTEKIDGIVALIMALERALMHKEPKSIYEERGVITL